MQVLRAQDMKTAEMPCAKLSPRKDTLLVSWDGKQPSSTAAQITVCGQGRWAPPCLPTCTTRLSQLVPS